MQFPPQKNFSLSAPAALFENVLIRFWWVLLFALLCYILFEQGQGKVKQTYEGLYQQFLELQIEKKKALDAHTHLLMQINSQSDPAWVELTLMKGLGLVPEGQTKVFFKKSDRSSLWQNRSY